MIGKGKCFSSCNRGQRNKSDLYITPISMIKQLLENEYFDKNKNVYEPCADIKYRTIVKECGKYFNKEKVSYNGLDLQPASYGDYLTEDLINNSDYVITNPPFSLAFEFIQKSKEVAKIKFAMLLPLSYLHGQKRYENKIFLDQDYPLTKIYVFTRYPLLTSTIRKDGKYNTGMQVYAWFIWENNNNCKIDLSRIPIIYWIDNNKYVLRKNDE